MGWWKFKQKNAREEEAIMGQGQTQLKFPRLKTLHGQDKTTSAPTLACLFLSRPHN